MKRYLCGANLEPQISYLEVVFPQFSEYFCFFRSRNSMWNFMGKAASKKRLFLGKTESGRTKFKGSFKLNCTKYQASFTSTCTKFEASFI